MSLREKIARRPFLASIAGLLVVSVVGAIAYEAPFWRGRRYPPTQFDDLLDQLPDRDSAAKLGRTVIAQIEARNDTAPHWDASAIARELRTGPGKGSIVRAVDADITRGRLVEVHGWVLPRSLAAVALLAA